MPGAFDLIGQCHKCHYTCTECSLNTPTLFTSASSDLSTLKTELKKGTAAVQTEADRIDTSVTD